MPDAKLVHDVMSQIGPLLDLAEVQEHKEMPLWTLEWDDGTEVLAEFDEEDGRLMLVADVGAMPETDAVKYAMILLQFNGLWHQSGGMRMGVNEGRILQMYDLFASDLELSAFSLLLTQFAEKAAAWTKILEDLPQQSETAAPGVQEDSASEFADSFIAGLRV